MTEGLDIDALASVLRQEYDAAKNYADQLAPMQVAAFKYYEADISTFPAREGGSQVILPDVQEAVDYMAQSVLRTFLSGERVVEFEATEEHCDECDGTDGEGGECEGCGDEQADEVTETINYVFMRQQDGARLLHDGLFDGLLKKIGVFKSVKETEEKVIRETVTGDPEMLMLQAQQGGYEIEEMEDNGDGTVTATLRAQKIVTRFVDYAIPVNRFKFSANARHEDTADYLCHDEPKTRSELVEMGFDREQVYSLPAYAKQEWQTNESSILDNLNINSSQPELEQVLLCEEYARIDIDDDGIAERVKVYRVENEILIDAETGKPSIEQVDDQPFAIFCPFPRPHRLVGYSLADKVMDLQLARSYVARQLFDGMAIANMPRPIVDTSMADADTINDILTPIPGSPIRVRGGASAVQPFQTGFDVGKSLQAMEWLTGERESRTGITRLNQGLDADALNKTATGTALMQAQGQQGEEMIARQLAETVSRLFLKKYRLMRAEGEPMKIKVDGQFKEIDPRAWPEDMNITVRVGLGSNSKDKRIQYRMAAAPLLQASVQAGTSGAEHVYKWFDGYARDTGLGKGEEFAFDPKDKEGMPQQPDPAAEAEKAKLELETQKAGAQLQLEHSKAQAAIETERMKADAQIAMQREKHAMEMQARREQADLETQLAREKMVMEAQLEREALALKAETDVHIATNRPGGALDA